MKLRLNRQGASTVPPVRQPIGALLLDTRENVAGMIAEADVQLHQLPRACNFLYRANRSKPDGHACRAWLGANPVDLASIRG